MAKDEQKITWDIEKHGLLGDFPSQPLIIKKDNPENISSEQK
jgi:hypothetical protein